MTEEGAIKPAAIGLRAEESGLCLWSKRICIMKTPLELYIHIPFCVRKCYYCDFFSGPFGPEERSLYFSGLREEIRNAGETVTKRMREAFGAGLSEKFFGSIPNAAGEMCPAFDPGHYEVRSVFFGGGTPSLLEASYISALISDIRETFSLSSDCEITLEANPGTLTAEKLKIYKEAGVNRLSIGLQSPDDGLLKALGRIHTFSDFLSSYENARAAGFDNINIDLMSGLPGETPKNHENALKKVLDLGPEHLSCYSLIIAENTPFYDLYRENGACPVSGEKNGKASGLLSAKKLPLPTEEEDRIMYHDTKKILLSSGYERYEVSNYALPGKACRHNIGYWTGVPYIGFGAAAASCLPIASGCDFGCGKEEAFLSDMTALRFKTAESLLYRTLPLIETELLSKADSMAEFMILGLRMSRGISFDEFYRRFGQRAEERYGELIHKYVKLGALKASGGRLFFTDYGMDVSNVVLEGFL